MGKVFTKHQPLPRLRAYDGNHESVTLSSFVQNFDGIGSMQESCCLAYELQPHCTENRHFHASICKSGGILIQDLTHNKEWTVIANVNKKYMIPKKVMKSTSLALCTVIGFSRGIVVIQCFYQRSVHFFVCDVNKSEVLCAHERRYQGQEKLHLFESYLSLDMKYIIIKKNPLFQSLCLIVSTTQDFILLKMSSDMTSCEEVPLPDMSFKKMAVMFDPSVPTKSFIVGRMNTCGPRLFRILLDDDKTNVTEDTNSACAAAFDKYSVLQHVPDQNLIILSVLGYVSCNPFPANRKTIVTNYMYNLDLVFKGQFTYTSPLGSRFFAPVFSPSGQFLSCAQQIVSLVSSPRLKSLKETCRSILQELVLSEDVVNLPIPLPLQRYILCENTY